MNEDLKLILRELLETKAICNALLIHLAPDKQKIEILRERILEKYRDAYPEVFR